MFSIIGKRGRPKKDWSKERVKPKKDLTGQRFGRLVVIEQCEDKVTEKGNHYSQWLCKCDCGNMCKVTSADLINDNKRSCNCLHFEVIANRKKYNEYDLDGEYGIGYTKEGYEFYFDKEDYDKIKNYRWQRENGYIIYYAVKNGHRYRIQMHRLLMNLEDNNLLVDHINHNRTDNRKENLRICTPSQNVWNMDRRGRNKSTGYTGIEKYSSKTKGDRYRVTISENNNLHHLGTFDTLEEAIKARKDAEKMYWGEFIYNENG